MPDIDTLTEYQRTVAAQEGAALSRPAGAGIPAAALPPTDAPLTTAGSDQPQLFPAQVDTHPLIAAVVPAVQATTEPANWAMTAATLLQALAPLQSQVFVASRASAKTQTQINLAEIGVVTLAGILQMFFPHPRAG